MLNETTVMKEVDNIRLGIYEEIKDMTPEERTAYFAASSHDIVEKYGIKTGVPSDVRHEVPCKRSVM